MFKTTVQWTAQHCQFPSSLWRNRALATEQVPLQRPNIQINLSQVLCLPPSSEWPTSSHPSDLSFSSETNVSTRHRDILAVCADLILDKGREQRRGKVITCAKRVGILAPHIQQPVLLNAPSKSVIQCEKNLAATTCGGLSPRQTLPPVCTPRQMTIGLKAWLAQRSPIQYLFSQFKALAAAHLVSAVQSNAPLIATLRLHSPQSRIL